MSNIYEIVAAISRPVDNMIFHQLYFQCIILKTIYGELSNHTRETQNDTLFIISKLIISSVQVLFQKSI